MGTRKRKIDAGKRFRAFREKHFLTQPELAGMLGIARETVSRIESGRRDPQMTIMRRFLMIEQRQVEMGKR